MPQGDILVGRVDETGSWLLEPVSCRGVFSLDVGGDRRQCASALARAFPGRVKELKPDKAAGFEQGLLVILLGAQSAPHQLPRLPENLGFRLERPPSTGGPAHTSKNSVTPPPRQDFDGLANGSLLVGESKAMQSIKSYVTKVAASDSTVLVTGQTGTGKELIAELIHRNSPRRIKPFVCINCAAIPDTLLESELFGHEKGAYTGAQWPNRGKLRDANGGTLFLDEIGDMDLFAQAKILRVIESRQVRPLGGHQELPLDIRIVAATSQDLVGLMAENRFRPELYFRLNVARVHLPPLRERKEDVPALSRHLVEQLNRKLGRQIRGLASETLPLLLQYDWPGNVRELKNVLEAAFLICSSDRIRLEDLPEQFRQQAHPDQPQVGERETLLMTLSSVNWNKSKAAKALHWSRMRLYRRMAKYQVREHGKPAPEPDPKVSEAVYVRSIT